MVEERKEEGQAQVPPPAFEQEYLQLSQQAPAKDIIQPSAPEKVGQSLTEAMDDATDLTDMQFAMAKMFPKEVKIDDVMVGRIAPEAFLSLLQLMITNDIMVADPAKGIDTNALLVKNYIKLTIGLDGKGRIDIAELLGTAREIKREDSLLKGL